MLNLSPFPEVRLLESQDRTHGRLFRTPGNLVTPLTINCIQWIIEAGETCEVYCDTNILRNMLTSCLVVYLPQGEPFPSVYGPNDAPTQLDESVYQIRILTLAESFRSPIPSHERSIVICPTDIIPTDCVYWPMYVATNLQGDLDTLISTCGKGPPRSVRLVRPDAESHEWLSAHSGSVFEKIPVLVEADPNGPDQLIMGTPGSSGYDLCTPTTVEIEPGQRVLINTGMKVIVPPGYELQVRPRSGLALKKGLTVINTPGTIDSDYRQTVGVILINLGQEAVTLSAGERCAQAVFCPVVHIDRVDGVVSEGSSSVRAGGFGSTGS